MNQGHHIRQAKYVSCWICQAIHVDLIANALRPQDTPNLAISRPLIDPSELSAHCQMLGVLLDLQAAISVRRHRVDKGAKLLSQGTIRVYARTTRLTPYRKLLTGSLKSIVWITPARSQLRTRNLTWPRVAVCKPLYTTKNAVYGSESESGLCISFC